MQIDLKSYLKEQRVGVESALEGFIQRKCISSRMFDPIGYATMAGGKRLRPILCLASAKTVGGEAEDVMPAACAIEMIHTYSLVHDDLPAMDNDDVRRGQATCHIQFDEASAILCGDALLNLAFEVLSEAALKAPLSKSRIWIQVFDIISNASGCSGMVEGQARDVANEGIRLSQSELQSLHDLKTGALIRASVQSGALLGGGSEIQIYNLDQYAKNIGLAFQVVDDVLNITGDPDKLGKAVGTDAEKEKNTYPALIGLSASRKFADTLVHRALQALSIFDSNADPLRAIAHYIINRNH